MVDVVFQNSSWSSLNKIKARVVWPLLGEKEAISRDSKQG